MKAFIFKSFGKADMDASTIWGIIFIVYILLALPLMSRQATELDLPNLPGKESYERKTSIYSILWIAGLVVIVLAWFITKQ